MTTAGFTREGSIDMRVAQHNQKTCKRLSSLAGFFCLLFFFLSENGAAQKSLFLIPVIQNTEQENYHKTDTLARFFTDTTAVNSALKLWQQSAFRNGLYEASADRLLRKDSLLYAFLHLGNPYEWISLGPGNVEQGVLDKTAYRQKKYTEEPFRYTELQQLQNRILRYMANTGHPFASVGLSKVDIKNRRVSAELQLHKGPLIDFGGIKLQDDSMRISVRFLENYLGIEQGAVFGMDKVNVIKSRIRELPYLMLTEDPLLTFIEDKAFVNLNIQKNKASRFDAVLGFLPSTNAAGSSRLTVTGTVNLDLQNTLGKGERLYFDFQRLKAQTQELKLLLNYPYLFNYKVGTDASLNIFKADSTFTDIKINAGLQYLFRGNNFLKLYWTQSLTNTGIIDKTAILQQYRLPAILDVDAAGYGLELQHQNLDYRQNPRKGWLLQIKSDFGNRKIRKNSTITSLANPDDPGYNYAWLYDSIALKSLRMQSQLNAAIFLPLMQQSTIKIGLQSAGLFSRNNIYRNEQYRIGGNRLLRGFDEASIFATKYAVLTLEYRFLFSQNSFFSVFSDASVVENKTSTVNQVEKRAGFGAGMTFETRAGLFSLAYALGKTGGVPIDIRNGKIHFGYLNYF